MGVDAGLRNGDCHPGLRCRLQRRQAPRRDR
jgi:hypothetical protein